MFGMEDSTDSSPIIRAVGSNGSASSKGWSTGVSTDRGSVVELLLFPRSKVHNQQGTSVSTGS
jgi:hypothetical protein